MMLAQRTMPGLLVAALATGGLLLGVPSSAIGQHPVGPATPLPSFEEDIVAWQLKVSVEKREVLELAERAPSFAGARYDNKVRELILYGAGGAPDEVAAAMQKYSDRLPMRWERVPFSQRDLAVAANSIDLSGDGIRMVAFSTAFDGLEATVSSEASPQVMVEATAAASGVPVRFLEGEAAMPLADRANDTSPYSGGARIKTTITNPDGTGYCSTGFRAYQGTNGMMLTAAHCTRNNTSVGGRSGFVFRLTGNNNAVGTTNTSNQNAWDVQGIDNQNYTNQIWVGGATQFESKYSINASAGTLALDEYVCLSGAWSGNACGTVRDTFRNHQSCAYDGDPCVTVTGGVTIGDANALAGTADSGGPAYQSNGDGTAKAAGLISAGFEPAACNGILQIGGVNRDCFQRVIITPWFRFRTEFDPDLTLD